MDLLRQMRERIIAEPDALDLRRVYADALTERGDPRGAFIHLQLGPRTPEVEAAETKLLAEHRDDWTRPVTALQGEARFARGFIEEWTCDPHVFGTRGKRAVKTTPLRRLTVLEPDQPQLLHLFKSHAFLALPEVELTRLSYWPFNSLAVSGSFTQLRRLAIQGRPRGRSSALAGMLRQPAYANLRELAFDLPLTRSDAEELAPTVPSLELLGLSRHVPLATAPRLRTLHVQELESDEAPLPELLRGASGLRDLSLGLARRGRLSDDVIAALPVRLERLHLHQVQLEDDAVEAICRLRHLRDLSLTVCVTTPRGDALLRQRSSNLSGEPGGYVRAFSLHGD